VKKAPISKTAKN